MKRRFCISKALARVIATCALVIAFVGAAPVRSSVCVPDGQIVTFEGVASARAREPNASRTAWVLNLPRTICVLRNVPFGPTPLHEEISAIRIIGTPPPLGVPLVLTGKLLLGRDAAHATLFVALEVIRGHRMTAPPAAAARYPVPPPLSHPRVSSTVPPRSVPRPAQKTEVRCDAPPYGGTEAGYQSFVQRYGRIVRPTKILAGICSAKFGRSPRDGLHKLGFSDAKIESENTEQLAADTIVALKTLVNTIQ